VVRIDFIIALDMQRALTDSETPGNQNLIVSFLQTVKVAPLFGFRAEAN